jgi:hypothetical protein
MLSLRIGPVDEPRLWTAGRIARRLRVPIHRVQYVLRSRRITPAARAGRLRLFDAEAVRLVEAELTRINAKQGEAGGEVSHEG